MKKDSLRTTQSERERQNYSEKLAENIALAFENSHDVDIYEIITDGPKGLQSHDALERLMVSVQELFEHEGWKLPSLEVTATLQEVYADNRAFSAIRKAAAKMRDGSMSNAQFVRGTARIIDNMAYLSSEPLIVGFHLYNLLLTARKFRKTNAEEAIDLVARCAMLLARLVVLLDSARRRRGAILTRDHDPAQEPKRAIYEAWKKWNTDRRTCPRPRDFRKAMLTRYAAISDGTLKNWMSDWPKGQNLPRQSSRC